MGFGGFVHDLAFWMQDTILGSALVHDCWADKEAVYVH